MLTARQQLEACLENPNTLQLKEAIDAAEPFKEQLGELWSTAQSGMLLEAFASLLSCVCVLPQTEAEVWQSSTQSKLPIFRRSIVLVGPPRVGKTCVRKARAKEAFNAVEESTDGIESCALDTSTWVVRGATSVDGFR